MGPHCMCLCLGGGGGVIIGINIISVCYHYSQMLWVIDKDRLAPPRRFRWLPSVCEILEGRGQSRQIIEIICINMQQLFIKTNSMGFD